MSRLPAVLVVLLLAAAPAVAADIDNGLYIGGGVGQTGIEVEEFSLDDEDNGYKAIIGWRIFKFLAVEANWVDFGSIEETVAGSDVELSTEGYDLSALLILPIGGHFELFARGGYVSWDAEVSSDDINFDSNEDGNDLCYGAGLAFRLGESFQIRAEYEQFEIEDTETVDLTSVSATFTF